jgi:membrane protein DedA with SNARE-associated domain
METVYNLIVTFCDRYGYPALFAVVLLENAGVPVPGETAVLIGGFLSSEAGDKHLRLPAVMAVTFVAAVLGDNMGFWLGRRWARPRLLEGRRFLFLTPRALRAAEDYFARYGSWTIFFARFITGLRVVGAMAAGTAGMSWPRFLVANAAGAATWSAVISLLGYFFGQYWRTLERWLGRAGFIALLCVVVLIASRPLWRHLRRPFGAANNQRAAGPAPAASPPEGGVPSAGEGPPAAPGR